MLLKIPYNLVLRITFIVVFIIASMNVPLSQGDNVSLSVPRGGLPVFARRFATDSSYYFNDITNNGTHIFCTALNIVEVYTINGKLVKFFGTLGSGSGQFNNPEGIAYANGNIYVADYGNDRIDVFSADGTYKFEFGSAGSGTGQFSGPLGVSVISNNLYVSDSNNGRIQVFDLQGKFIRSFGSEGYAPNQFVTPGQIAFVNGKLYITDNNDGRVKVWDTSSNFLFEFGNTSIDTNYFYDPYGIATTNKFIYVSSEVLGVIYVFDLNGNFQSEYNGTGTGQGTFNHFTSIMILNSILYGVDTNEHLIDQFVFLNPPQDLHAYTGINSISLVWQKPQYSEYIGIASYQIYRSTDGANFSLFATSTSEYFTDNLVSSGMAYYYKITAVAKNGFVGVSDYSNTVNATLTSSGQNTNNNASNSSSTKGGFLPLDTIFMIFSLCMVVLLVRKKYKLK